MCCRGCGIGLGVIAIAIGLISIYCGSVLPPLANNFLRQKIIEKKALGLDANGDYNEVMKKFLNPPYPMKIEFWIYNTTNAEDLMLGKSNIPIIQEIGPYAFDMKMSKKVDLKQNGTRMFYRTYTKYYFNKTATCPTCSLDDDIITPNLAFQGLIDKIEQKNAITRAIAKLKVGNWENLHSVYRKQWVRELLFEGYVDVEINDLCDMPFADCPSTRPDRIGLYYKRNGTNVDGEYEIDTGRKDVNKLGKVYSWNGMNGKLNDSYWFGEEARLIEGTDAQMFQPFVLLERKPFKIFTGQACRSLEMEFQGFSVVGGLPMQRYGLGKSTQIENEGFCGGKNKNQKFFDEQNENCPPQGLMELDGCNPDALRIYASNGHYYGGHDKLRDNMEGFPAPNRDDDTTFLDIEPHIGVVTQAKSRSLLSVGVRGKSMNKFGDMMERVMPLVMLNISTQFDSETRELIKKAVMAIHYMSLIPDVFHAIFITFFIVAVICFTCDAVKIGAHRYRYRKIVPKKIDSIFVPTHGGTAALATNSPDAKIDAKADKPLKSLRSDMTVPNEKPKSQSHSLVMTMNTDPLKKV